MLCIGSTLCTCKHLISAGINDMSIYLARIALKNFVIQTILRR